MSGKTHTGTACKYSVVSSLVVVELTPVHLFVVSYSFSQPVVEVTSIVERLV